MTLSDRICQGLRLYLMDGPLGSLSTIQAGIEADATSAATSRIICRSVDCSEYKPHLWGIYLVSGEIVIRQSIDEDDAETKFRDLCTNVKCEAGDQSGTPAGIMRHDDRLEIYNRSWHLDAQSETSGERGFQSIFTWRAIARDTLITN